MRPLLGLSACACFAVVAFATSGWALPHAQVAGFAPTLVEYFCSPGFAPQGGRCVATASRDEIQLFEIDPYADPPPIRRRHRRHGLRKLY